MRYKRPAQTKRSLSLSILQKGQVHRATGIVLTHDQLVPWLNRHYPNWQTADYGFDNGHNYQEGKVINANYERPTP